MTFATFTQKYSTYKAIFMTAKYDQNYQRVKIKYNNMGYKILFFSFKSVNIRS